MAVEPHKHCPVCGTPIPLSERACSPDCEKVIRQREKQMNRNQKLVTVLLIIFILVWAYFVIIK
ncbi:MAG: DUF2116 family Zn-ribbon domain-containing protein [Methanobrevibacter wolinii]|uniref:DUF2116 family Zn-ribbon domain-containing protein n=1 Tax=Methanobrevibacter wolinii TaxID=190977 RepID=UPI0005B260DB|nr:DUF2116 family Zn-ribbon domain-containing protein [Methanobrevibacter wolinii]MDD5959568.1 DUF2116 family Zn-ribbon domain-containing protein [Methanobrevibacter wolinii]